MNFGRRGECRSRIESSAAACVATMHIECGCACAKGKSRCLPQVRKASGQRFSEHRALRPVHRWDLNDSRIVGAQVGPAEHGRGQLEGHNAFPSLRGRIAMGLSGDMVYPEADSRHRDVDWEYLLRDLAEMRSVFAVGHTTTSSSGTHTAGFSSRNQEICPSEVKSGICVKRYRCCLNRSQETPWGFKFKALQPVARRRPQGVHVRQQLMHRLLTALCTAFPPQSAYVSVV